MPLTCTAVGPDGTLGLSNLALQTQPGGDTSSVLLATDGTTTPVTGPDLDRSFVSVLSIADRRTALVVAYKENFVENDVLWQAGWTVLLPFAQSWSSPACLSPVLRGGSVLGAPRFSNQGAFLDRHTGGVPGRDVVVDRAELGVEPAPSLACSSDQPEDKLAGDGGIAGAYGALDPAGGQQAAYWNAAGTRTVVPLEAGETTAFGAVVARGGRMVVRSTDTQGEQHLWYWHNGKHVADLTLPDGWRLIDTVKLTDTGLLLGDARNSASQQRPVVWNLARRW